jgi:hypothetical protein
MISLWPINEIWLEIFFAFIINSDSFYIKGLVTFDWLP